MIRLSTIALATATLFAAQAAHADTVSRTGPYGGSVTKERSFSDGTFNADVSRTSPGGGIYGRTTTCGGGSCSSTWSGTTARGRSYGGEGRSFRSGGVRTIERSGTGPRGRSWSSRRQISR